MKMHEFITSLPLPPSNLKFISQRLYRPVASRSQSVFRHQHCHLLYCEDTTWSNAMTYSNDHTPRHSITPSARSNFLPAATLKVITHQS